MRITLSEPWATFDAVLADSPGMIPSPTALRACGETPPQECEFNVKPVGAGPFMVESFTPRDAIVMVRNPEYYGGEVPLDGVRWRGIGDGGSLQSVEAIKAGQFDVAILQDPAAVAAAKNDDDVVWQSWELLELGRTVLMNMGLTVNCSGGQPAVCAGHPDGPYTPPVPTMDPTVRHAIAAAIDVGVINERAFQGTAPVTTDIFGETFPYDVGVDGPQYDPERARELVEQAKSDGWNGSVRWLCQNTPTDQAVSLAIVTMLEAAGIEVVSDTTKDAAGYARQVIVDRDYDLACWGNRVQSDDLAWGFPLFAAFHSTSPSNRNGWKSPDVDAALDALRVATTDDEKAVAYRRIADAYVEDVPFLSIAPREEGLVMSPEVHGIDHFSIAGTYSLHEAWLSR